MPHPAAEVIRPRVHTGIIKNGYLKLSIYKTVIASEARQSSVDNSVANRGCRASLAMTK